MEGLVRLATPHFSKDGSSKLPRQAWQTLDVTVVDLFRGMRGSFWTVVLFMSSHCPGQGWNFCHYHIDLFIKDDRLGGAMRRSVILHLLNRENMFNINIAKERALRRFRKL